MEGRVDVVMARAPRPRRPRSAQESLAQVVLAFESIVVFLAGLVVYGLQALPGAIAPWWGIVGGSVVALIMLLASGTVRWRWGIVLGWVLQIVLASAALLVPAILIVALLFGGLWAYATIKGAALDRRNALLAAERSPSNGD